MRPRVIEKLLQGYHHLAIVFLMMAGFYILIAYDNLVKKLIGLNLLQMSVFLFFILMGKVGGGSAPILEAGVAVYSNPLPHVLILTAIVVGVSSTALGLALAIRINRAYGSLDERVIGERQRARR